MLAKLKQTVIDNGNVFAVLVDAVKCCSLGQISSALYEVGGQYRRDVRNSSAGEQQPGPERAEEKRRRGQVPRRFHWSRLRHVNRVPDVRVGCPVFLRRYRCRGAKHRSSAVTGTVTAISGSFVCATFDAE
jgi:hypothetical protein